MSGNENTETGRRDHRAPYTAHHPIPTIQRYREEKQQQQESFGGQEEESESKLYHIRDTANRYRYGEEAPADGSEQPYQSENKNTRQDEGVADDQEDDSDTQHDRLDRKQDQDEHDDVAEDTSQALSNEQDPKQKDRKSVV